MRLVKFNGWQGFEPANPGVFSGLAPLRSFS